MGSVKAVRVEVCTYLGFGLEMPSFARVTMGWIGRVSGGTVDVEMVGGTRVGWEEEKGDGMVDVGGEVSG